MTLQPYDGANRVLLPDGRECWEKETEHFGESEISLSYQYSISVLQLPTDYFGRVLDLRLKDPNGSWGEVVIFKPTSLNLVDRVRATMDRGWRVFAKADTTQIVNRLYSDGYLAICADILAMVRAAEPKS